MKINKTIKQTLDEISKESIKLANTPDANKYYIKRLLKVFSKHLTEEEQVYLILFLLENMHLKTLITDPDNIIQIHNLRLREHLFIFILVIVVIIVSGLVFTSDISITSIVSFFSNIFKLLSL